MNNADQNQGTWAEPSQPINSASANLTAGNAAPYGQQPVSAQQPTNNAAPQQPINSASAQQPVYSAVNGTSAQQPMMPPPYTVVRAVAKPEDTEETKRLKQNYGFFGPAAFLYAVFYTFCMFRNGSGVTFPFFVAGSLLLLCLSLSRLEITLKSGSAFYMVGMMLLGISTFLTDDQRIIVFNNLGIFLLLMSLLLKQFFNTAGWRLGKYLGSIIQAVFMSLGEWRRPVQDGAAYQKNKRGKKNRTVGYIIAGCAISVPLLMVVLALLSVADVFFYKLTMKVFGSINLPDIMDIILYIGFMFFFSYMLIAWLCRKQIKEEVREHRTWEPVIAITVTSLLTFIYLIFSAVQIAGLFLGKLQLPQGYTYAGYARQGFFQLLAVSILNLVIVLVCMSFFRESKVLKAVLTVMSLCTFVMIASSAMRMIIYIRFYYLTFLRILVLWSLALLAVLFAGILVNIYWERFPLFRYSMAVVTVFYLALSFAHPDYIIASVNVASAEAEAGQWWADESVEPYHDFSYLSRLSADAAPVLVPYMERLGYDFQAFEEESALAYGKQHSTEDSYLRRNDVSDFGYWWMEHLQDRTENLGIRTFNLSRYYAMRLLRGGAGPGM